MGSNGNVVIGGGTGRVTTGVQLATAATQYVGMYTDGVGTVQGDVIQIMPYAGQLKNFYVVLTAVPGGIAKRTFTVYHGTSTGPATFSWVATAASCQITGTAISCSDLSDTATYGAGDAIAIQAVPASSPALTYMYWTATYAPTP